VVSDAIKFPLAGLLATERPAVIVWRRGDAAGRWRAHHVLGQGERPGDAAFGLAHLGQSANRAVRFGALRALPFLEPIVGEPEPGFQPWPPLPPIREHPEETATVAIDGETHKPPRYARAERFSSSPCSPRIGSSSDKLARGRGLREDLSTRRGWALPSAGRSEVRLSAPPERLRGSRAVLRRSTIFGPAADETSSGSQRFLLRGGDREGCELF